MTKDEHTKLQDIQTDLFDAEVLLLRLSGREGLTDILNSDCPEVVLGALLEKACALVSEATGWSTEIIEESDGTLSPSLTAEEAA